MKKIYSIFVCLCLLAGFVACEKDKDFALNTLAVNDEMVTPSFETAEVICSFKADATISDAFVQYSLSSSFAKYEVAKMTEDKGKYTAHLTGLVDNTTYYIRYSVSNKYSSVVAEKVAEFKTLPCTVPTIVLDSVADVKENQAKVHLHLTSNGGAVVTDMGICWSKQANPTTKDIHKSTDDTLAVLDVTDLQPNTQYYVRAYAMNKIGIAHSEEVVFTTLKQVVLPTVTTTSATSVTETSAVTGGNVTSDGNASVTERGVVYATTQNPTTANTKVASGNGTGSFVCNLSGLQPNTKYYIRAYAINSKGTAYGEEISFTTNQQVVLPTVKTTAASSVTETSAVTGGNVTSDGNANVTERGVVYAPTQNPTTANTKVASGSGTGSFVCNLSGLQPNTKYYVRAYAINGKGTAYGEEITFITNKSISLPIVTTAAVTSVTETSAVTGGNVTSDGNASVTERGVVYSTNPNPVITNLSNTIRPCGSGTGEFTYTITGLQANTKYYVRAYAKNDAGTAYGEEISFVTNENTSHNGYEYVDLGLSVKWATMNVGAEIPEDYGDYFAWGETAPKEVYDRSTYKWCNGSKNTLTKYNTISSYGTVDNKTQLELSDDAASVNWGGSWRIPTNTEMTELREQCTWTWITQNGVNGYKVTSKSNGNSIFLPAAGYYYDNSSNRARSYGYYWSSLLSMGNPDNAWFVYYDTDNKYGEDGNRYYGRSIRAVFGEYKVEETPPIVTTTTATSVTETSAVTGGNVISDGNATVTERGVVYATTQNPTTANTKVASGSGTGSFTCNLSGLQPNTTYYVRAYAINSKGTAYGTQVTFTTSISIPTVTTTIVSSIRFNYAMTGGNVTSDGGATVTERGVVYSTTKNPTTTSATKVASGSGTGVFTTPLGDLSPNTTYYVRAYATNSVGTAYGTELTFTTEKQVVLATVTTASVSQVTTNSAFVEANVTNDGGGDITERGFVFSTEQYPTTASAAKIASGTGTGAFSSTIDGLTPSTKYYVRAYAKNSAGTVYGGQAIFTTSDLPTSVTLPTVTTTAASSIKETSAVTGGNVTSDGNATVTERGIVYNTYANPTVTTAAKVLIGSGTGAFTYTLTGLQSNTKYYVRAYAVNEKGTAYGSEITFTTKSAESGLSKFGWDDKNDMFQDCMADCGVTGLPTLDELKAAGTESFATICNKLTDVSGMMELQKWDWLTEYIMTIQNADPTATALVAGTSSAGWRYAVAAFFLESQRTGWPKSADFSEAGKVEAFLPYIK